jgi:hypothetical protein
VLTYSDHARFWENDYDAVLAIENTASQYWNPNYHTIEDRASAVTASQLTAVTRMFAGAVARLAHASDVTNIAVFDDDVAFYSTLPSGFRYRTEDIEVGEPLIVRVDFHVFGPERTVDATLEVWDGPPDDGGRLLSSQFYSRTMGGGEVVTHEFDWEVTDADAGDHEIYVSISAPGIDEPTSDNTVHGIPFCVYAENLYIALHFAWPNPARDASEVSIAYRPSREIGRSDGPGDVQYGYVEIKIFDLLGQDMGSILLTRSDGVEWLEPTLNPILWSQMDGAPADPPSGVYIYQISVYDDVDSGDPDDRQTGKFAVVR